MDITYLGHSGFLVETAAAYFLFDYIRGELPLLSDAKKLYVFVSHAHGDHWNREIFSDDRLRSAAAFILGFDIKEPFEEMCMADPALSALPVLWAYPHETLRTDAFTCETLLSTDEGVAFLLRTPDEVIYHAGDLNWWHWNQDPKERNLERERNFKNEISRLRGIHIDAAFIPLDPRQEDAHRFCMDYCLETLDIDHIFPMHFWKSHRLCREYHESLSKEHPDWYQRFRPVSYEGERFQVPAK